jgi:hypothetical protein
MRIDRREFVKAAGIAAATLVLGRGAYSGIYRATPRGRLRRCWLQLVELGQKDWESKDRERLEQLTREHAEILEELVVADELDEAVAGQIAVAFGQTAGHWARLRSPATCYMWGPPAYTHSIRQLIQQAEILARIAWIWPLTPVTVARAQANVERDLAALSRSVETEEAARFLVEVLLER